MMSKVVYISSMGHSGSTLLSLLLARHPKIVSLGEVKKTFTLARKKPRVCTCGRLGSQCPVWSFLFQKDDEALPPTCTREAYSHLLHQVSRLYPEDHMICDSTKSLSGLTSWKNISSIQPRVIFLVKDIRSYLASYISRSRLKEKSTKDGFSSFIKNRTPVLALEWRRWNLQQISALDKIGIDYLMIGYEELCFDPKGIMGKVYEFLSLPPIMQADVPNSSGSHILHGNRMRFDKEKSAAIRYDYQWMNYGAWINVVSLPFLHLNRRLVYRNSGLG